MKILIGGDVAPIGRNERYFIDGDIEKLFNDLLTEFKRADLSVINLECPLINESTPILKSGPVLGAKSACINGIRKAGIDVVSLANNHIMDHGPAGLKNTLRVCTEAGVSTVGAGMNLSEARRILIKEIDKVRIGVLAVAEHEFSIATDNSWGANPLDLIDYVRNVKEHWDSFDYLIVLLHGGNEGYPFPSPRLKNICHFMVEMGANAVIVQHSHCPGCYEEYRNAHIVYGQGDLLFDRNSKVLYKGFLVKLLIEDDLSSSMEIIPYVQDSSRIGIRRMRKEEEMSFRQSLIERSNAIKDETFVQDQWLKFCEERKHYYFSKLLGHNSLFDKLNSQGLLERFFYKPKTLLRSLNIVSCEAHREVLETIFRHWVVSNFSSED